MIILYYSSFVFRLYDKVRSCQSSRTYTKYQQQSRYSTGYCVDT